jgi:hypothetical protein
VGLYTSIAPLFPRSALIMAPTKRKRISAALRGRGRCVRDQFSPAAELGDAIVNCSQHRVYGLGNCLDTALLYT